MCEKLDFCLLLIGVQGGIEDRLKVGRGGGSIGGNLGHGEKKLVNERGSTAASCSVRLMVTDMERHTPADTRTDSLLQTVLGPDIPVCREECPSPLPLTLYVGIWSLIWSAHVVAHQGLET